MKELVIVSLKLIFKILLLIIVIFVSIKFIMLLLSL